VFGRQQKILIFVAHPDDESIGAGILLQRHPRAHVVFCTSGSPNTRYIWFHFGHPAICSWIREREARAALRAVGAEAPTFLGFRDGELYRSIPKLFARVAAIVETGKPDVLLTHAYEAGHPDHDVCAFIGARLSERFGIPVWEMPYYRGDPVNGGLIYQRFLGDSSDSFDLAGSETEVALKRKMFRLHKSQQSVLAEFDPARESVRPQPQYDFSAPPAAGISATAVCNVPLAQLASAFQRLA
jgi:N-acetylglucosamine malate deacetylase 2